MSAAEEIPSELGDAWRKLHQGGDARRLRRHLPVLQQSITIVSRLESSLKEAFGGIKAEEVDPGRRADVRAMLVSSLQSHSLSIGAMLKAFSHLSAGGQGAVQTVLGWIAEHVVRFLTAFADHLGLENWSVAAQLSTFPPGASFTVTLTFT